MSSGSCTTGRRLVFSGKIDSFRGRLVMSDPEFEPLEKEQVNTGRLVPVYPLTQGISERWLRKVMKAAIEMWSGQRARLFARPRAR